MKRTVLLILSVFMVSCSVLKQSLPVAGDEELIITRKFVGIYLGYRHTGPSNYEGPNLIWIKTSMQNRYGIISANGKECDFTLGDRLYIRRSYVAPTIVSGYWIYTVENDSSVSYKATDFQHDRKEYIRSWFEQASP